MTLTHEAIDRELRRNVQIEADDATARSDQRYPPSAASAIRAASAQALSAAWAVPATLPAAERLLQCLVAVARAARRWRAGGDDGEDPDGYGSGTFGAIGRRLEELVDLRGETGRLLSLDVRDVAEGCLERREEPLGALEAVDLSPTDDPLGYTLRAQVSAPTSLAPFLQAIERRLRRAPDTGRSELRDELAFHFSPETARSADAETCATGASCRYIQDAYERGMIRCIDCRRERW